MKRYKISNWIFRTLIQCFTANDEHRICVRNIQLKIFYICSLSIKRFHPYFELLYFRHGKAVWSSKFLVFSDREWNCVNYRWLEHLGWPKTRILRGNCGLLLKILLAYPSVKFSDNASNCHWPNKGIFQFVKICVRY